MPKFAVTFGTKYNHEAHPTLGLVCPDGYITILADSYEEARETVNGILGDAFAFMYDEEHWPEERFVPMGELLEFSSDEIFVDAWEFSARMIRKRLAYRTERFNKLLESDTQGLLDD